MRCDNALASFGANNIAQLCGWKQKLLAALQNINNNIQINHHLHRYFSIT